MTETLLYERRGPAVWLTLNRPDKLNAINADLIKALHQALDRAEQDDDVKVIVLAGAGRAFSAGYDLADGSATQTRGADLWRTELEIDVDLTMRLWALPKPTIAAVHGWCLAGGCDLMMACDLAIATDDARFGEPEIRFGSGPVTMLMPFLLGQRKTNELLFTGDAIAAAEAHRLGLVNDVVPADALDDAVVELVRRIVPTPLPVLRLTKLALVRAYESMGLRQAVAANLDLSAILNSADTPEQREFDRIVAERGLRAALDWRDDRYGGALDHEG